MKLCQSHRWLSDTYALLEGPAPWFRGWGTMAGGHWPASTQACWSSVNCANKPCLNRTTSTNIGAYYSAAYCKGMKAPTAVETALALRKKVRVAMVFIEVPARASSMNQVAMEKDLRLLKFEAGA